jgi:hypothetical protein
MASACKICGSIFEAAEEYVAHTATHDDPKAAAIEAGLDVAKNVLSPPDLDEPVAEPTWRQSIEEHLAALDEHIISIEEDLHDLPTIKARLAKIEAALLSPPAPAPPAAQPPAEQKAGE